MKLHIFGASGSGVTTLGLFLSAQLQIPYFDSDDYFWEESDPPFTTRRDPKIRNQSIRDDLSTHENWIFGGSAINWGDNVFPEFDLIVFLWVVPKTRIERLKKREVERYGDSVYSDPDRNKKYVKFIAWAADYDHATGISNRTLKAHENWLQKVNTPVLRLINLSVRERAKLVLKAINLKIGDKKSI